MVLPIRVSEVYFGYIDTPNEIMENQSMFKKNFYDVNSAIEQILTVPTKSLILGKKGTGKTAIGKYIELMDKTGIMTKYLSFDDFDYKQFRKMNDPHSDEYEKYKYAWKWVLLASIGSLIIKDTTLDESEAINDLHSLIKTIFGSTNIPLRKLVNRKLKRGFKLPLNFISSYLGEEDSKQKIHYSPEEIAEVFEVLINDIEFNGLNKYYLIIDGLDEKIRRQPIYTEAITSLLWEVQRLNRSFHEACLPIKLIVLLRQDVFELLGGSNLNKINYDNSVRLTWISSSKEKMDFPLAKWIALRINNSLIAKGYEAVDNPLRSLLPKHIHSKKRVTKSWDWILDMTTYKPRDIVAFFNCCKELCNQDENELTESIIWDALKDYSRYLATEFKSELYGHLLMEQSDEIFESIFAKTGKSFSFSKFISLLRHSRYCDDLDAVEILKLFYSLGIVGIIDEHGNIQWIWRDKTIIKKEISSSRFQIHSGLWKVLAYW